MWFIWSRFLGGRSKHILAHYRRQIRWSATYCKAYFCVCLFYFLPSFTSTHIPPATVRQYARHRLLSRSYLYESAIHDNNKTIPTNTLKLGHTCVCATISTKKNLLRLCVGSGDGHRALVLNNVNEYETLTVGLCEWIHVCVCRNASGRRKILPSLNFHLPTTAQTQLKLHRDQIKIYFCAPFVLDQCLVRQSVSEPISL